MEFARTEKSHLEAYAMWVMLIEICAQHLKADKEPRFVFSYKFLQSELGIKRKRLGNLLEIFCKSFGNQTVFYKNQVEIYFPKLSEIKDNHTKRSVVNPRKLTPKNKNKNKNKNITSSSDKSLPDASDIILYLNTTCNRSFSADNEANYKPVLSLIKKGYKPEDLKSVVDYKKQKWGGDDKMRQYLRPTTLFGASKFGTYLDEAREVNNADKKLIEMCGDALSEW